jgi:hypothetical protein
MVIAVRNSYAYTQISFTQSCIDDLQRAINMTGSIIKSRFSHAEGQMLAHGAALIVFNTNPALKKWYQENGWKIHAAILMVLFVAYSAARK